MHTTTISLAPGLTTKARRALSALRSNLRGGYHDWLRARQAAATACALKSLDGRLLRDIGLDRSELLSAAAELHGQAERERRHSFVSTALAR